MKRIIIKFGLLIFIGSFVLFPNPRCTQAQKQPTLVVAEADWPPYFFAGKPNTAEGFAKELLKMIFTEMDYNLDYRFYPVNRMYSYLENGEIDICVLSYNKEREDFLIYAGEPLFVSGYRAVIQAGKDIQISSLHDFDSLRVGHLAGLKYSKEYFDYIEKRKKSGSIVTTTTGGGCLKMLLAGMIDIFVDTRETTLWRAKQMKALDKIKILDFDIQTKDYFVTISKQSKIIGDKRAFLEKLDQSLRAAKGDGRYAVLAKKYGIE
jgi:ABC-type amino acid transport substrate-binding protein